MIKVGKRSQSLIKSYFSILNTKFKIPFSFSNLIRLLKKISTYVKGGTFFLSLCQFLTSWCGPSGDTGVYRIEDRFLCDWCRVPSESHSLTLKNPYHSFGRCGDV